VSLCLNFLHYSPICGGCPRNTPDQEKKYRINHAKTFAICLLDELTKNSEKNIKKTEKTLI